MSVTEPTVTWLPGRVRTRNQAATAMVLAETVAGGAGDHTDERWLFIEGWANEFAGARKRTRP